MRYLLTLLLMTVSMLGAASIQKASIVSAAIGVTPAAANDPVFNSVTHVWHLGEALGNARADSVGSISLNETGGGVDAVTGVHGNAAFMTAGQSLDSSSFSDASSSTYSFWANFDNFDDTGTTVFNKSSGITSFNITGSDGDLGGRLTTVQYHSFTSDISVDVTSLNITPGTWFFVVLTFNGVSGAISLSVNGGTYSTGTGIAFTPGSGALTIGDPNFGITVDEFYTYNTVLTQGNVTTLYGGGTPTVFYFP